MDERVSRRWLRARPVILAALLAAAFMILASTSTAQAKWHWWGALKAECRYVEIRKDVFEDYANVSATMVVANEGPGSHWAGSMRIEARLVPDKSHGNYAENWGRHWSKSRYGPLLQNHTYHQHVKVSTDTVDPTKDWKVEYKLIWDRAFPFHDVGSRGEISFDTCEPRQPGEDGEGKALG